MDEENERRSLTIFGRDISQIPCYRSSILYGLGGGAVGGLVCFMLTSRPRLASNFGFGTMVAVTLGYWVNCRYEYSKNKVLYQQLEAAARRRIRVEGTDDETKIEVSEA